MLKALGNNRVIPISVLVAATYAIMRLALGLNDFIIVLNGLFVGSVITVALTYSNILVASVFGDGPYDRVRQMALGIAIAWVAIVIGVISSVIGRANGQYITLTEYTPISRYLAVVAAIVQVTAPDLGEGIFFGRDRRLLYIGVAAGLAVAIAVILLQS